MGRQRGGRRSEGRDPRGDGGPVAGTYEIDTGNCELEEDPFDQQSWILRINGEPSSHIDLADPRTLAFDYMRWISELILSQWDSSSKLRVLHLGGGACTLARAFASLYPDARQVVVELDGRSPCWCGSGSTCPARRSAGAGGGGAGGDRDAHRGQPRCDRPGRVRGATAPHIR